MKKKSLVFISAFVLNYLLVVCVGLFLCKPDEYGFSFTLAKFITTAVSMFFGLWSYQLYLKHRGVEIQKEKKVLSPEKRIKRKKFIIYFIAIAITVYNILFIILPWVTGQTMAMIFVEKITDVLNFNFYFDVFFNVQNWFHNTVSWRYDDFVKLVDNSNIIFNATSSETFHAMFVFTITFFFFSKIVFKEEREKLFSLKK